MTTSAIVDSVGNSLHSNFTENPDEECILVSNLGMLNRTYKLAKTVIGWYLSRHFNSPNDAKCQKISN
ncbi:hypothetical protein NC651_039582 [Populus alba x Populus x berolinensis]|nr:hypothetical protein NC651_039582 [Populus alba x Populus x berolinensis]